MIIPYRVFEILIEFFVPDNFQYMVFVKFLPTLIRCSHFSNHPF